MQFANYTLEDIFIVRLKGIKDINYPQIKLCIYRGYRNQFGERMWGKSCRIYILNYLFFFFSTLHTVLTHESYNSFIIRDWYVIPFLNWNTELHWSPGAFLFLTWLNYHFTFGFSNSDTSDLESYYK